MCQKVIPYNSKTNPRGVESHMESTHLHLIENFNQKKVKKTALQTRRYEEVLREATKDCESSQWSEPKRFFQVSRGIGCKLCAILYDFRRCRAAKVCDFAISVDGRLKLPSRNKVKKDIDELAIRLANRIKKELQKYCLLYALTSDLWSSRTMQALLAMTIHFFTEDFTMRNFTLEVCPVIGKHTADMIRGDMDMALSN